MHHTDIYTFRVVQKACKYIGVPLRVCPQSTGIMLGPPPPPSISSISDKRLRLCNNAHVDGENPTSLQSQLFDNDGRLSVALMIRERQALQAQTSIHSERTFEVIMEPNHRLKRSMKR